MTRFTARQVSSRRSFLKFGAAALAGASAMTALPAFADDAAATADAYGGLPIGAQSYTFRSMSIDNALKAM